MKPIASQVFLAALLATVPTWVRAQQPAPTLTPATTATPPAATPADPAAAPPVVRLPAFNLSPAPSANATGSASTNLSAAGSSEFGLTSGGSMSSPVGSTLLSTNRPVENRGAIPKMLKPERRGVGGFLTGFANLFNPLAPVEQGAGGATEYWYDGQINTAPLPRAFQDERYHEAGLSLIRAPIDGDLSKDTKRKSRR
ncbi:MAG: hypothetical protein IT581_02965 [Verrucomicrobiales bacterium]|nr:hypothetical protein [Verrucomicrobiales bacterium]